MWPLSSQHNHSQHNHSFYSNIDLFLLLYLSSSPEQKASLPFSTTSLLCECRVKTSACCEATSSREQLPFPCSASICLCCSCHSHHCRSPCFPWFCSCYSLIFFLLLLELLSCAVAATVHQHHQQHIFTSSPSLEPRNWSSLAALSLHVPIDSITTLFFIDFIYLKQHSIVITFIVYLFLLLLLEGTVVVTAFWFLWQLRSSPMEAIAGQHLSPRLYPGVATFSVETKLLLCTVSFPSVSIGGQLHHLHFFFLNANQHQPLISFGSGWLKLHLLLFDSL